ncbi:hypothetical protein HELRODRAFT_175099 [Helobdella robusta]|uniref:Uncharacterized protein n=1 Tax=Helobdella robusta TaxID=6412 RepID=T1F8U6_HELRO|nr:hypothetical protein HELRODRAFT_175099 [Helobdella robusta]ESO01072.1 hypothetical protein HELRODRAFT_175099 [Helobdella robusta]
MASRPVKINELLYFINNNLSLIEEESFINNTSEFYTSDDIVLAIKTLKCEIDSLKLDKMEKFPSRGNSKHEKLLECLTLFRYIKNNNLLDKIALFCSSDINKIPNTENWLKINFDFVNKQIKEMLFSQQAEINKMFLSYTTELDNVKNKLNSLVGESRQMSTTKKNVNNEIPTTSNAQQDNILQDKNLWSNRVTTPVENLPFSLVLRKNKRPRSDNSSTNRSETDSNNTNRQNNNSMKYSEVAKKVSNKIVGNKVSNDCKLKAEKQLIKKSFFMMSNIQRCHRDDVVEYLSTNGIKVISCFPVVKKTNNSTEGNKNNNDDEQSTMFRVCVESCDASKMKDPDIILKHIIVREWRFNQKKPEESNNVKHD